MASPPRVGAVDPGMPHTGVPTRRQGRGAPHRRKAADAARMNACRYTSETTVISVCMCARTELTRSVAARFRGHFLSVVPLRVFTRLCILSTSLSLALPLPLWPTSSLRRLDATCHAPHPSPSHTQQLPREFYSNDHNSCPVVLLWPTLPRCLLPCPLSPRLSCYLSGTAGKEGAPLV